MFCCNVTRNLDSKVSAEHWVSSWFSHNLRPKEFRFTASGKPSETKPSLASSGFSSVITKSCEGLL